MGMLRSALVAGIVAVGAVGSAGASPPVLRGANFWVKCYFSHVNNDDAIVYPGKPGWSHSHTYFGNESTDAFSTPAKLRIARTNCKEKADRAAYWVPTLYDDGRKIRPGLSPKRSLYGVLPCSETSSSIDGI